MRVLPGLVPSALLVASTFPRSFLLVIDPAGGAYLSAGARLLPLTNPGIRPRGGAPGQIADA